MPFQFKKQVDNFTENKDLYIITNFLTSESFCFNTKARVPTKMTVECVLIDECCNWDKLIEYEEYKEDLDAENRYKNIIYSNIEAESKNLDEKNNQNEEVIDSIFDQTSESFLSKYENLMTLLNDKKITFDEILRLLQKLENYVLKNENIKLASFNESRISNFTIDSNKDKNKLCDKYKDIKNNIKNDENNQECNNTNVPIFELNNNNENQIHNNNDNKNNFKSNDNNDNNDNQKDIKVDIKFVATKNNKDPFGEDISLKEQKIRNKSSFRNFKSYRLVHMIAKANDDLRQEQMVMQILMKLKAIFTESNLTLKIHTYHIEVTSSSSGFIQFLPNTNSIDGIKKSLHENWTFVDFFKEYFKSNLDEAQLNFAQSLAGSSLACYLLNIKDRHNGNILLDNKGNIIHIDFGFVLGISPGNMNFEAAPFKLTSEYVDIMGVEYFEYFKVLLLKGFIELKRHVDELVNLVSIMSKSTKMPCFNIDNKTIKKEHPAVEEFRDRFHLNKTQNELKDLVEDLIKKSNNNFWTNRYDNYQYITNGIRY